jgi:hypothetical protein
MGIDIDIATGYFSAHDAKLLKLAKQARQLLQCSTRASSWLLVKELRSFAVHAQYMFLATPAARFFLRELHSVLGYNWGGRVRLTPLLGRDMQWWTQVPSHANGKNINRHVETIYIYYDGSSYGWGAVLNNKLEARGLWGIHHEHQHIT